MEIFHVSIGAILGNIKTIIKDWYLDLLCNIYSTKFHIIISYFKLRISFNTKIDTKQIERIYIFVLFSISSQLTSE